MLTEESVFTIDINWNESVSSGCVWRENMMAMANATWKEGIETISFCERIECAYKLKLKTHQELKKEKPIDFISISINYNFINV